MNKIVTAAALAVGLALPVAALADPPKTVEGRHGYAIGFNMGNSFKSQGMKLEVEALLQGIKAGYSGQEPILSRQEMAQAMQTLQQGLMDRRNQALASMVAQNKAQGEVFLKAHAAKPGVKVTPSGLQYEVVQAGPGVGGSPKPGNKITVHYQGTLTNGQEFDSSIKRGKPMVIPLKNLVPGWIEALGMMKKGDKWRIVLPSKLGYGDRPNPPIPPGSVLVFELELIDFEG